MSKKILVTFINLYKRFTSFSQANIVNLLCMLVVLFNLQNVNADCPNGNVNCWDANENLLGDVDLSIPCCWDLGHMGCRAKCSGVNYNAYQATALSQCKQKYPATVTASLVCARWNVKN